MSESVYQKKLVAQSPSVNDILSNYQSYCERTDDRRVKETVLGYVTPVSHIISVISAKDGLFKSLGLSVEQPWL